MVSFGDPDDDCDATCYSCGRGYDFEIGIQITCPHCGGPVSKPGPPSRPLTDADIRDDLIDEINEKKQWIKEAERRLALYDAGLCHIHDLLFL